MRFLGLEMLHSVAPLGLRALTQGDVPRLTSFRSALGRYIEAAQPQDRRVGEAGGAMRKPNENCQTFFCGSSTLLVNLGRRFFRGVPVLGKFIRWCAAHIHARNRMV